MRDQPGGHFGALLRRHRLVAGLSQQALADRSGLSVDAIAALERGRRRRPRAFTVRLLADTLDLDDGARQVLASASEPAGTSTAPTRVPPPFTELVGRIEERDAVASLLRQDGVRLVTLTGPGGVGKTQLALDVVRQVAGDFPGGVGWVALSQLGDAAAITQAVATSFGVRDAPGRPLLDPLTATLATPDALLLLDNCEHLVGPVTPFVEHLLMSCSGLRVLATSRERLRLPAEIVRPVAPLAVPGDDDEVDDSPAVALFVRRARQLLPDFRLTAADRPAVARICRELDGLPLALELAAARVNVLSIRQLAASIDEAGCLTGSRDGTPRHRTLRAAIDWSYELLGADERRALRQLAVFAGGWSLQAAAATCPVLADEEQALTVTASLVDKSLAIAVPANGQARYFLLFTVRRYALEKLRASGDLDAVATTYARYVTELAERAAPELHGPRQVDWLDRLDTEVNNVRAVLAWASGRRTDIGVRLAGALWRYCYLRGRYGEGRAWLTTALAGDHTASATALAGAQLGTGVLAFLQCEYDLAAARIEAALRLYREHGDRRGVAESLQRLGSVARERGDYERALRLHEESRDLWHAAGDQARVAESRNYLGFVAWLTEDPDAVDSCRQTLAVFRRLADAEGTAWALLNLGAAVAYLGEPDRAERLLRESLALADRTRFAEGVAWSLNLLGVVARRTGRAELAGELLVESLRQHLALGDRWRAASVCEELAAVTVATDPARAARLLGAADELRSSDARRPPVEQPDYEQTVRTCREALGAATFTTEHADGRTTPPDTLTNHLD
ncbi:MAG: tetratricopeptide repeat protein [Streptosporangiales bacterium]|nr:tetratricopeptide repeat protein [Streptosporangiales bacterium]